MNKKEYHKYIMEECKRQWNECQAEDGMGTWDEQDDDTKAEFYNSMYPLYLDRLNSDI